MYAISISETLAARQVNPAELAGARALRGRTFEAEDGTLYTVLDVRTADPAEFTDPVRIDLVDFWGRRTVWTGTRFLSNFPASF